MTVSMRLWMTSGTGIGNAAAKADPWAGVTSEKILPRPLTSYTLRFCYNFFAPMRTRGGHADKRITRPDQGFLTDCRPLRCDARAAGKYSADLLRQAERGRSVSAAGNDTGCRLRDRTTFSAAGRAGIRGPRH